MPTIDAAVLESIVAGIRRQGWFVVPDAVPRSAVDALRASFAEAPDAFAPAGIGRDDDWQRAAEIRRDRIRWLDPEGDTGTWYFEWIESLRLGLNAALFLGLFDYECHLAWYQPGAFYAAHLDAFRGDDNRKISTVLYLNDAWQDTDGGELVLYRPVESDTSTSDARTLDPGAPLVVEHIVRPTGATLVCFLSEEIPHEVLPASADRFSIAGWFRVNASGGRIDPPLFPSAEL